ncbi:hypothetical protein BJV78DRAFT_708603 [Lactifluus subvellereus]|nr:hypothetical protein BJV78DRAFT_708603 [Lactifluus subvellereus]
METHASSTTTLTNGVVHARISMLEGMDITLYVSRVLPDVLVFDRSLPRRSPTPGIMKDSDTKNPPTTTTTCHRRVPSPLPHAFACIQPNTWFTALSAPTAPRRDWNEWGNTTLRLSAWLADVPLEVLPGCESEFRSFVSKVIFGRREGAVAGVLGVVVVDVRAEGLARARAREAMLMRGLAAALMAD